MKIALFANTDWYLYNFRLSLACALRKRGDEVILISPLGEYISRLQKEGFRWIEFPFSRWGTNPFSELAAISRLTRLYRQEHFDIVHHFTIKCMIYGSLAARFSRTHRIVNSITGLGYVFVNDGVRLLRWLVINLYRFTLKNTSLIFQNPDDLQAFVSSGLVSRGNATLIPGSGVDIEKFSPSPEPAGYPIVLLPGRMLYGKGVAEFSEAAQLVKEKNPHIRFVLVGNEEPSNPDCIPHENISAWNDTGLVEWWGWKDDMAQVYAQTHIICLPSHREGLPRGLLEAAACGRPLVATDIPGCREVLKNNNGILFPLKDVNALATAIQTLAEDPQLRLDMGKRGRELVVSSYSSEKIIKQTLAVYDQAQTPRR